MNPLMDELTFRSYAHNRTMFPDVQPERWAAIFQNVPAMEERLLKTFIAKVMQEIEVADQATGSASVIDSLQVGDGGEANGIPSSPLQDLSFGAPSDKRKPLFQPISAGSGSEVMTRSASNEPSSAKRQRGKVPDVVNESGCGAPSSSLPVPLGREVSGTVEGHGETQAMRTEHKREIRIGISTGTDNRQLQGETDISLLLPLKCRTSENQASPADQLFSYFPLAEIVEKVFKQRSFLCN